MTTPWIERIDERMDAIASSLTDNLTGRIVKRSLLHYDQHTAGELADGVVTLVSEGESNYREFPGKTCIGGRHSLLLICHLKVDDTETPQAIEAAELHLIEEIKAFLRTGVPGMDFEAVDIKHSRQLEYPYGWVVVALRAVPPKTNSY